MNKGDYERCICGMSAAVAAITAAESRAERRSAAEVGFDYARRMTMGILSDFITPADRTALMAALFALCEALRSGAELSGTLDKGCAELSSLIGKMAAGVLKPSSGMERLISEYIGHYTAAPRTPPVKWERELMKACEALICLYLGSI